MRSNVMRMLMKAFLICILTLAALPAMSFAAGPKWVEGYPKLVQKNALLQWVPVKGAKEYMVYKGEAKGAGKVIATVKSNKHIDSDIPAGKTYYYSVAAVIAGKEGERSSEGSVTTAKVVEKVYVPIKLPKLQEAHIKTLPDGRNAVGLRWENMGGTDLVSISVYRSDTKGKDYAMVGSASGDMYEDSDVAPGKTYYYVVTAVDNQLKESKYSNEVAVALPAAVKPAEAAKAETKLQPTKMRSAKLLFRITGNKGDKVPLAKVMDVCADEGVGHIYVTSMEYGGVLVYDMQGNLQFGIRKDGISGSSKFSAKGLGLGPNGTLFIADYSSPVLDYYDFTGKKLGSITVDSSHTPNHKKDLSQNYDVAVSQDGTAYTSDPITNSIYAYDRNGERRFAFAGAANESKKDKSRPAVFNGPTFITVLKDGNIVFVDSGYSRLVELGPDGKYMRTIGKSGQNAGELSYPAGLAAGNDGEIFVGSATTQNIQAFSPEGKFLYAICNERHDGPPEVNDVRGIFIDGKNRLYVAEGATNRVSVFQLGEGFTELTPPLVAPAAAGMMGK